MYRSLTHSLVALALLTPVIAAEKDALVPVPGEPALTAPEGVGFKVAADAKTQKTISPTAFAFDEKGVMYLAETHRFRFGVEDDRDHLYWYLDDIASQTNADRRALHEKWKAKVPLGPLTEKSEIIRRLEDADKDGVFEKSDVYADGFNDLLDGTAAGVFALEGNIYFASIPKVWRLKDTNGDGKADERDVIQDGFGPRISFSGHDLNGFALGPDGRIYGTVGDRGFNVTTREGRKYVSPDRGAVFRFDPDGSNFEVVHTGLRNPKEIAFDDYGNAITVDNNSDQGDKARVVYIVEGGDSGWTMEHQTLHSFHREIGLTEHPPNRWMVEKMWQPKNDDQPAYIVPPVANLTSGPSGLTYHPGTGFLESEAGRFLICDYRASAPTSGVWSFKVEPSGAGMALADARQLVWGTTATDVEYSFDGKLYIADFKGGWTSHEDGRVLAFDAGAKTWRAKEAEEAAKIISEGFDQRPAGELAGLLRSHDQRVRIRAQIALTRIRGGIDRLKEAVNSENPTERLHGVWGLGILARRGSAARPGKLGDFVQMPDTRTRTIAADALVGYLSHPDPEVRAQAVKALGESPLAGDGLPLGQLLEDPSPRVRQFAAITIGKLKALGLQQYVYQMLDQNADFDPYLRSAGAYALQMSARDPRQLGSLVTYESKHVRLAAVIALRRMKDPQVGQFINDSDPKVVDEVIRAISDEQIEPVRPLVAALLDQEGVEKRSPFMLRRLVNSAFRLGGAPNAKRLLTIAGAPGIPAEIRHEALRLISVWPNPPVVDQAIGKLSPLEKRDPELIKPVLTEALPDLLKNEEILADALALVSQFDITVSRLDDASLKSIVEKESLPGSARAKALSLYAERKPEKFAELLAKLAVQPNDDLAMTAVNLLVKDFPKESLQPLIAAAESKSAARSQAAWKNLAKTNDPAVTVLFVKQLEALRAAKGVSPSALELLAAAKERSEADVKKALEAYDTEIKGSADPVIPWLSSLEGGNAERGASLFASQPAAECLRCHRAEVGGDLGGEAGPNLAGVASRGDRRYLLESLVSPSTKVVSGYGIVSMTFANGASLGGILLAETPDHVDIDASGKHWRVNRKDITSLTPPVSAMPPMGLLLKPDEVRDLVAWLDTLKKGEKAVKASAAPPVLDPATLKP